MSQVNSLLNKIHYICILEKYIIIMKWKSRFKFKFSDFLQFCPGMRQLEKSWPQALCQEPTAFFLTAFIPSCTVWNLVHTCSTTNPRQRLASWPYLEPFGEGIQGPSFPEHRKVCSWWACWLGPENFSCLEKGQNWTLKEWSPTAGTPLLRVQTFPRITMLSFCVLVA